MNSYYANGRANALAIERMGIEARQKNSDTQRVQLDLLARFIAMARDVSPDSFPPFDPRNAAQVLVDWLNSAGGR